MKTLNAKERAVLDLISERFSGTGLCPSVRELCAALGYKSTSTVQAYLERLIREGYLIREDGKKRSVRPANPARPRPIPLLCGAVPATGEIPPDCFAGTLDPFLCAEDLYAVRLSDGEYAVFRREDDPPAGSAGVFLSGGGAVLTGGERIGSLVARIGLAKNNNEENRKDGIPE